MALAAIWIATGFWRRKESFLRHAYTANVVMLTLGCMLMEYKLVGYYLSHR